jgi:hypothetical protein
LADALETGSVDAAPAINEALARERPIDPLAAINLQKAQIELQNMLKPQPGFRVATPQEAAVFGATAGQFGPDNRFYPSESQAGYRQVTGAQIGLTGADAQKLFNLSPEGQITAIGGAGTTVNVDTGAGGKFEEAFAKLDADAIGQISATGSAAIRNMGRINQLETILSNAPQGAEGAIKLAAGEFGIPTEGLDAAQAARAIINSLVPEQRAPGSGPMSDADLNLFKESLPRIVNQPGGNALIISTMRAIAEYDAQGADIVQRLRAGEIDRTEAFRLLQSRPDPFANFKAPAASSQPVVIDGVTIRKVE